MSQNQPAKPRPFAKKPVNLLGGMGTPAAGAPPTAAGGPAKLPSKPHGHGKPAAMKATSQASHVQHEAGRVVQQRPAHGAH